MVLAWLTMRIGFIMNTRRKFVIAGAAAAGGMVAVKQIGDWANRSKAEAKVVIVGGGAAGITMAAYLSNMLKKPDITLIEPNEIHHYQPGYTMVAGGVFKPEEITKPTAKLIPKGVRWVKDAVTEVLPEKNALTTLKNGTVAYDFLVLVPGCQLNFDLVEGISRETLGEGNAHCIYDYNGAQKCRDAIRAMQQNPSGKMVFTNTYTKVKCGGAPKKITLLADDYLRDRKSRDEVQIDFYSNSTNLMTPAVFGDRLATLYKERDITAHFKHRLVSVDTGSKKAVFEKIPEPTLAASPKNSGYEQISVDYDFLHFLPPMSAPGFIRDSSLAITEGKLRHGGWVDVDINTMQHNRYKNIISLGDSAGLPTSKTGAAIRIQAPLAAANLISMMEDNEPTEKYTGYTACPIVTEYGKVLMCEFGYGKELDPTIPWLDPGVERGMWWMLKKHGLKPMYYQGMLKGLI
jgi:sulfide:quinone oxidoreductase